MCTFFRLKLLLNLPHFETGGIQLQNGCPKSMILRPKLLENNQKNPKK